MALRLLTAVPSSSFIRSHRKGTSNRSNVNNLSVVGASKAVATANVSDQKIVRRSANYHPPIWEYDYIQSLKSDYLGESFNEQAIRLVGEVRMILENVMDPLEKLELIDTLQRLEYMKICFLALYNSINEIAFDNLKEHGFHTIPFLKIAWAELCKSYLVEAKWYYSGYIPTFKEYIDNAWISISAPVILSHVFFSSNVTKNECLEYWKDDSNLIYCSSMILRLADDLGTSVDELKRGDVPKSIQCYMHETGCSEEEACKQVKTLIDATWKRMNEEYLMSHSSLSLSFKHIALNLARMAQCMYQYGDGHGVEDQETKDRVLLLLVSSIPYLS
ncbi:hypothetical protein J1N35_019153 [Gossypium stocksii]|uniref:Terpene synthase metal-binding domain-containing protein n=1 Tax=Gossypium stocksii TaxID=47602 RepID=A0A9D3VQE5_9ROSI|nr:hypothetical protein J1N35_019153 [Gossypium stocksii]